MTIIPWAAHGTTMTACNVHRN